MSFQESFKDHFRHTLKKLWIECCQFFYWRNVSCFFTYSHLLLCPTPHLFLPILISKSLCPAFQLNHWKQFWLAFYFGCPESMQISFWNLHTQTLCNLGGAINPGDHTPFPKLRKTDPHPPQLSRTRGQSVARAQPAARSWAQTVSPVTQKKREVWNVRIAGWRVSLTIKLSDDSWGP